MSSDRMVQFTFRVPRQQLAELNDLVADGEFPNQSEAVRSALRTMLKEYREEEADQGYQHPAPPRGPDPGYTSAGGESS